MKLKLLVAAFVGIFSVRMTRAMENDGRESPPESVGSAYVSESVPSRSVPKRTQEEEEAVRKKISQDHEVGRVDLLLRTDLGIKLVEDIDRESFFKCLTLEEAKKFKEILDKREKCRLELNLARFVSAELETARLELIGADKELVDL